MRSCRGNAQGMQTMLQGPAARLDGEADAVGQLLKARQEHGALAAAVHALVHHLEALRTRARQQLSALQPNAGSHALFCFSLLSVMGPTYDATAPQTTRAAQSEPARKTGRTCPSHVEKLKLMVSIRLATSATHALSSKAP